MTDGLEQLRTGLSGRFDIRRELGRGGMAVVYLAHDIRHDRDVALKLLRPELRTSISAERFLREIRFAAQLQHPHILPLHDSGIVDETVFYVMPFVDGESLRDRLRRLGPFSIGESLTIALQVADALAYAHERGVVHRDIKPENVLLVARGTSGADPFAVVADFGIARALSERGAENLTGTGFIIGTPAYMSPEQAVGDSVDARSDVYSLGCVLHEMLTGRPPFGGEDSRGILAEQILRAAPAVSESRKDVPASVDALVRRALAKQSSERFHSAAAMATALRKALADAAAPASQQGRKAVMGNRSRGLLAVGALTLLFGVTFAVVEGWSSGIPFTERDWIVVADVDNQTGDEVFDRSLTSALMTAIQQSQHVNVLPQSRVREMLRHMQRPDSARLDEATAREVAQRIGSPVVLATTLTRIDSVYQVSSQLLDPPTADVLRTISERARGRAGVLGALDKVVGRVRRELNEPSFAIRGSAVPLPLATTSSLEALKRYADGSSEWNQGRYARAHELYSQALTHDSMFVQAQVALGASYYYRNLRPDGERYFVAAESLLPRLTERERLLLGSRMAGWRGRTDEEISLLRTYLARYPRDQASWYNYGTALFRSRRCADALLAFEKSLELDSMNVGSHINSAMCHADQRRPQEAVASFRRALAIAPDIIRSGNLNHEYGTLLQEAGQPEEARRTYELMLAGSVDERSRGLRSMALFDMAGGRFTEAVTGLRAAIVQTRVHNSPISEYRNRLFLAVALQHLGRANGARAQLDTAYAIFGRVYLEPWLLAYGGRLFVRGGNLPRARELRDSLAARMSSGSVNDLSAREVLDAEIARAEGRPEEAARILEITAGRPSSSTYVLESLAEALADKGDLDAATLRFRELAEQRSLGWEGQEGWLLAHFRLGVLAEARGDTAAAVQFYNKFLDRWKDGDAGLVEVIEARRRVAALSEPG